MFRFCSRLERWIRVNWGQLLVRAVGVYISNCCFTVLLLYSDLFTTQTRLYNVVKYTLEVCLKVRLEMGLIYLQETSGKVLKVKIIINDSTI